MRKIQLISSLSAVVIGSAAAALCPVILYGFSYFPRFQKSIWFLVVFIIVSILSFIFSKHYLIQHVIKKQPLKEQHINLTIFVSLFFIILGEIIYMGNKTNQYTYPTEIRVQITSNSRDFSFDTNPIVLFGAFGDHFGKNTDMEEEITEDGQSILHYTNIIWIDEDLSLIVQTEKSLFGVQININDQVLSLSPDDMEDGSFGIKVDRKNFPPYSFFWSWYLNLIKYRFIFLLLVASGLSFFIIGIFEDKSTPTYERNDREVSLGKETSHLINGHEREFIIDRDKIKSFNIFQYFGKDVKISTIIFTTLGISFLLFFIWPTFLNSEGMYIFHQPVARAIKPIGIDGHIIRTISREWFLNGRSLYEYIIWLPSSYTPIAHLFHLPTSLLPDSIAMILRTFTLLFSYIYIAYYFPILVRWTDNKFSASLAIALVLVFFSYGLQFEIERGNSNLIAMALVIASIQLFHFGWKGKKNKATKIASILLFALGAQLKIYPLIFGIFLITDWRKWGENIRRFLIYGVVFLSGFFILGYSTFLDYLRNFIDMLDYPDCWVGNHSLFCYLVAVKGIQDPTNSVLYWLYIFFFIFCFILIVYSVYYRKSILDPGLWVICTIFVCILPSTSHDIKLPLFYTACIYYFVMMERNYENRKLDSLDLIAFVVIGLSMFSLYYSPENRELLGLASAFPFFVWVSVAVTVQSVRPIISTYLEKQKTPLSS